MGRLGGEPRRPPVVVEAIEASSVGPFGRVAARVDGHPVWFESGDAPLVAAAEAFGSALLLPALHAGRGLRIDAPVCSTWRAGATRIAGFARRWWGYPRLGPEARAVRAPPPSAPSVALCFSAGVDSSYALRRSGWRCDLLVTAQGFDVPLDDGPRMAALRATLAATEETTGARPIVVRTNLREHPLVAGSRWIRDHGGALAALGHLLRGEVGTLLVSSAVRRRPTPRLVRAARLEPLASAADLRVVVVGETVRREMKVAALAHDPLVRHHLRVCWENRAPRGNCSRCAKCVGTMILLAEAGVLERFPVFDGAQELAARVAAVPHLTGQRGALRRVLRRGRIAPDVARELRALLRR